MTPAERATALRDDVRFRAAALEQPAAASGMLPTQYDLLMQVELESKFPTELRTAADAVEAIEAARVNLRTVTKAIENELAAVGQKIVEREAPQPSNEWAA
jgi:hypothetical protein